VVLTFYKTPYEGIAKIVIKHVFVNGHDVYVSPDGHGKRSGGMTREVKGERIIIYYPPKPTYEEFEKLVPEVGKKFLTIKPDKVLEKYKVKRTIEFLKKKPETRRAVFTLHNSEIDYESYLPCFTAGQFLVRNGMLELYVWMRSNDAYNAFIGNVMEFVTLMHIVAEELGVEPAKYEHFATSLHIYDIDFDKVRRMIR